jgi:hypothetical protein
MAYCSSCPLLIGHMPSKSKQSWLAAGFLVWRLPRDDRLILATSFESLRTSAESASRRSAITARSSRRTVATGGDDTRVGDTVRRAGAGGPMWPEKAFNLLCMPTSTVLGGPWHDPASRTLCS